MLSIWETRRATGDYPPDPGGSRSWLRYSKNARTSFFVLLPIGTSSKFALIVVVAVVAFVVTGFSLLLVRIAAHRDIFGTCVVLFALTAGFPEVFSHAARLMLRETLPPFFEGLKKDIVDDLHLAPNHCQSYEITDIHSERCGVFLDFFSVLEGFGAGLLYDDKP